MNTVETQYDSIFAAEDATPAVHELIGQAGEGIRDLKAWVVDAERVLTLLEDACGALEHAHLATRESAVELARELQKRTAASFVARDVTVLALARVAESRDPETGEHLERMQTYTQILARRLARQGPYANQIDDRFLRNLYYASPLHDLGKVGIPDEILLKPGPLTAEEFEVMKKHAEIGAAALKQVSDKADDAAFINMATEIARHHHERFDGRGYPDRLCGTDIPLPARIVALADVFDALTSVRVYKAAVAPDITRTLIERENGKHFDPVGRRRLRGLLRRLRRSPRRPLRPRPHCAARRNAP